MVIETRVIRLSDINPFDDTHIEISEDPGFEAIDKSPNEHIEGARHCAHLIDKGAHIRPIAICRTDLVPVEKRNRFSDRPWQRIDGFKRYWGHYLAGKDTIACLVYDEYLPGAQHGLSMEID